MIVMSWLLTGVLAVVDWYAVARGDRRTETWAKPATLVALILTAVLGGVLVSAPGLWLVIALVFGLLGDVFLLGETTARFQAGLAAFLIGHLAYVVCFWRLGLAAPGWAWFGLLAVVVALGIGRGILPATHRTDGAALSIPVAVYMAVIGAMTVAGWATGEWLIALGATVFVSSDTMLALNRFVRPWSWARLAVMVTYHVGQALIVLGVLNA